MNRRLIVMSALTAACFTLVGGAYAKETLLGDLASTFNNRPQSAPGSAQIDVGFSPDAGAEDLVVKAIATARQSILLGAYSFTSKPVIQGLIAAKRRGVEVRCVLDKSNVKSASGRAAANLLVNAGIPTRIDSQHPIHHNKYMVIDGAHVETGSFNYSAQAAHKNAENALVIWNNPVLAKQYANNWAIHWGHSEDYQSTY
jgi:phosphatidylserine/phosphatidylglycerophosphate/cardiolipin synthase-like enzyme